jgi:organic hydroperoxide reductase OsmC/OhrA
VAKFSPIYEVPIEEAEVDVRATHSVADKYGLGGPPGAWQQVTFDLKLKSSASESLVGRLIAHAERACHAAQTFRAPVPVALKATLNGRALALP